MVVHFPAVVNQSVFSSESSKGFLECEIRRQIASPSVGKSLSHNGDQVVEVNLLKLIASEHHLDNARM